MHKQELGLTTAEQSFQASRSVPLPIDTHVENDQQNHMIYDYYSVKNDLTFVREQKKQGVGVDALSSYIKSNLVHFLEEFAGQVKGAKIHYRLDDDGHLYYPGVATPIKDTYRRLAEEKGENSREMAEIIGFESIEEKFATNKADAAFWISPPSFNVKGFGTYGFIFAFVKNGKNIEEHILRYDDEDQGFSKSFDYYCRLLSISQSESSQIQMTDEKSYLKDPLFMKSHDTAEDFKGILKRLGFDQTADLYEFSRKIEKDTMINSWLVQYTDLILTLSDPNIPQNIKPQALSKAKQYLQAIYNRATDLKSKGHENDQALRQIDHDFSVLSDEEQFRHYLSQKPLVIGGGSCPASNRSNLSTSEMIRSHGGVLDHQTAKLLTTDQNENNKWDYHKGDCVNCKRRNVDVGPCSICRKCEDGFNKKAA